MQWLATIGLGLTLLVVLASAQDDLYGACYHNETNTDRPVVHCPTSVVNRISTRCREHWMRKLVDEITRSYVGTNQEHCPVVFDGSLMVDHLDSSSTNYKDPVGNNCGKLISFVVGKLDLGWTRVETPVSELIRTIGERVLVAPNNRLRSSWNRFTQYSIMEPSVYGAAAQVLVGVKEAVYSIRTSELAHLNYPNLIKTSAIEVARRHITTDLVAPKVYMSHVLYDEILPLVQWQYNRTNRCPSGCDSFVHGVRCRRV